MNINYRKNYPYQVNNPKDKDEKNLPEKNTDEQKKDTFQKAAYPASGKINISQVLADFKNTIIAINAPEEIQQEVNLYLSLVERESSKETPSRDIIITNLVNASKISDSYIAGVLKKDSNVVEGWITTLFQQKIDLKANPKEINPDFLLKFPQKAQEKIDKTKAQIEEQKPIESKIETAPQIEEQPLAESIQPAKIEAIKETAKIDDKIEVQSAFELSKTPKEEIRIEVIKPKKTTPFTPINEQDTKAKELLLDARKLKGNSINDTKALNLLNEALGLLSKEDNSNKNIKAALHLERGKVFDKYDYVDYAIRDYFEATKAQDLNLKAQAFYKLANIYDEFKEFDPALNNYLTSVAYSGEADNLNAQTKVLSKIATLYTKQFDLLETINYTDLAIETALDTKDDKIIADTYSTGAQNYQYLGENKRAIENYKNALKAFSRDEESYEQMAYNYEQAAITMEKLGNIAKARKLQERANQYYQKAQLDQELLEQAG